MTFKIIRSLSRWNRKRRLRNCLKNSGFWYVDIPRTGSSWLRDLLFHSYGWPHGKASFLTPNLKKRTTEYFPAHTLASDVRQAIGVDLWESLFTFSVVRNPFDRIASLFLFYKNKEKIFDGDFTQFCAAIEASCHWVPYARFRTPLWTSQKSFLSDGQGNLLVRHVGRFEKYQDFMAILRRELDLGEASAPSINASVGKPITGLTGLYDQRTAGFVAEFFAEDFETFDYPKKLPRSI